MIDLLLELFILFGSGVLTLAIGYRWGQVETEKRWSDAVRRKAADDEAGQEGA